MLPLLLYCTVSKLKKIIQNYISNYGRYSVYKIFKLSTHWFVNYFNVYLTYIILRNKLFSIILLFDKSIYPKYIVYFKKIFNLIKLIYYNKLLMILKLIYKCYKLFLLFFVVLLKFLIYATIIYLVKIILIKILSDISYNY